MESGHDRIEKLDALILRGIDLAGSPFQDTISPSEAGSRPDLFTAWIDEARRFLSETVEDDNVFAVRFTRLADNTDESISLAGHLASGVILLQSLRSDLIENPSFAMQKKDDACSPAPEKKCPGSRKIFVVHGHTSFLGVGVEEVLISLGLEPILLHRQPEHGETFFEKTDAHPDAGFAVILFTADVIGGEAWLEGDDDFSDYGLALSPEHLNGMQVRCREYLTKTDRSGFTDQQNIVEIRDLLGALKMRARQNVVLECGFFIGLLGREHVAILSEPGIEIPTDLLGLSTLTIDDEGVWKKNLAGAIHASGIPIDEKDL